MRKWMYSILWNNLEKFQSDNRIDLGWSAIIKELPERESVENNLFWSYERIE